MATAAATSGVAMVKRTRENAVSAGSRNRKIEV
jgi:hypothetical protein